jgi:pyruvate kinase
MLIATVPPVHQERLLQKIVAEPSVDELRYNTGLVSAYSPQETIERIVKLAETYRKKLWIDLKGRQLRIVQWAVPNYGKIVLNHEIEVELPAKIVFRGDDSSEIKLVRENIVYVDPPPKHAVGAGQAVNVLSQNLKVKGYLTKEDREYIKAAISCGARNFMLSFVESLSDIEELQTVAGDGRVEVILKIESIKGMQFIKSFSKKDSLFLMAARDDLVINLGKVDVFTALKEIIAKDPQAIVASKIFSGLESTGFTSMADFADLMLMKLFGYRNFMLSDGICLNYFDRAVAAWKEFNG